MSRGRRARTRLSALELTAFVTTVGATGLLAYLLAISAPTPIVAVPAGLIGLALAGLILTGRRWTPALGSLFSIIAGVLIVGPAPGDVARTLAQPSDPLYPPLVILLPMLALGLASGAAATAQNLRYARPPRHTPLWLAPLATGLAGVALGGWCSGACHGRPWHQASA